MKREIKGNLLIYCLFQISNICLSVLGFFTFVISVYLMILSKTLNFFNILFFAFGVFLIIIAYYGCKMRNAPIGNLIYTVILSSVFLLFSIVLIIFQFDKSTVINTIVTTYELTEDAKVDIVKFISKNVEIVNDLLLIICSIFVINKVYEI